MPMVRLFSRECGGRSGPSGGLCREKGFWNRAFPFFAAVKTANPAPTGPAVSCQIFDPISRCAVNGHLASGGGCDASRCCKASCAPVIRSVLPSLIQPLRRGVHRAPPLLKQREANLEFASEPWGKHPIAQRCFSS
jgi:hypothetical protein